MTSDDFQPFLTHLHMSSDVLLNSPLDIKSDFAKNVGNKKSWIRNDCIKFFKIWETDTVWKEKNKKQKLYKMRKKLRNRLVDILQGFL